MEYQVHISVISSNGFNRTYTGIATGISSYDNYYFVAMKDGKKLMLPMCSTIIEYSDIKPE